jgi:hypothetical protein
MSRRARSGDWCVVRGSALALLAALAACDPPEPAPPPARPAEGPTLVGEYDLTRIEGRTLPVVVADGPDGCVFEVAEGVLLLRGGTEAEPLAFELRAVARERCAGEVQRERTEVVEGAVSVEGGSIVLEGQVQDTGDTYRASGELDEEAVVLRRAEADGTVDDVNWVFERRAPGT